MSKIEISNVRITGHNLNISEFGIFGASSVSPVDSEVKKSNNSIEDQTSRSNKVQELGDIE